MPHKGQNDPQNPPKHPHGENPNQPPPSEGVMLPPGINGSGSYRVPSFKSPNGTVYATDFFLPGSGGARQYPNGIATTLYMTGSAAPLDSATVQALEAKAREKGLM